MKKHVLALVSTSLLFSTSLTVVAQDNQTNPDLSQQTEIVDASSDSQSVPGHLQGTYTLDNAGLPVTVEVKDDSLIILGQSYTIDGLEIEESEGQGQYSFIIDVATFKEANPGLNLPDLFPAEQLVFDVDPESKTLSLLSDASVHEEDQSESEKRSQPSPVMPDEATGSWIVPFNDGYKRMEVEADRFIVNGVSYLIKDVVEINNSDSDYSYEVTFNSVIVPGASQAIDIEPAQTFQIHWNPTTQTYRYDGEEFSNQFLDHETIAVFDHMPMPETTYGTHQFHHQGEDLTVVIDQQTVSWDGTIYDIDFVELIQNPDRQTTEVLVYWDVDQFKDRYNLTDDDLPGPQAIHLIMDNQTGDLSVDGMTASKEKEQDKPADNHKATESGNQAEDKPSEDKPKVVVQTDAEQKAENEKPKDDKILGLPRTGAQIGFGVLGVVGIALGVGLALKSNKKD